MRQKPDFLEALGDAKAKVRFEIKQNAGRFH